MSRPGQALSVQLLSRAGASAAGLQPAAGLALLLFPCTLPTPPFLPPPGGGWSWLVTCSEAEG